MEADLVAAPFCAATFPTAPHAATQWVVLNSSLFQYPRRVRSALRIATPPLPSRPLCRAIRQCVRIASFPGPLGLHVHRHAVCRAMPVRKLAPERPPRTLWVEAHAA